MSGSTLDRSALEVQVDEQAKDIEQLRAQVIQLARLQASTALVILATLTFVVVL